ncbi:hypothetical protein JG688_00000889 [Phytophthora aleatoria]|uniref:DDE-1 domain-containing protein n=1 Tax=Phytophthora aleatoria TaxID=2496075 RepID=A0A8J5MJ22_9STRA|nr:hypothetical protein JG688_00000889 [Phytophthora aleatoria]
MDAVSWEFYVNKLLKYEIEGPTGLLLDSFDCHASEAGQRVVAEGVNPGNVEQKCISYIYMRTNRIRQAFRETLRPFLHLLHSVEKHIKNVKSESCRNTPSKAFNWPSSASPITNFSQIGFPVTSV